MLVQAGQRTLDRETELASAFETGVHRSFLKPKGMGDSKNSSSAEFPIVSWSHHQNWAGYLASKKS